MITKSRKNIHVITCHRDSLLKVESSNDYVAVFRGAAALSLSLSLSLSSLADTLSRRAPEHTIVMHSLLRHARHPVPA